MQNLNTPSDISADNIVTTAKNAKAAFLKMMNLSSKIKNNALKSVIKKLEENRKAIFEANEKDLKNAKIMLKNNEITKALYERLKLNETKLNDLINGLYDLIELEDTANKLLWEKELDNGLILKKVSVPIGVMGVIFEARPDCFIQISSLIIKSGNCAILKGGSECRQTNKIFYDLLTKALDETEGFPKNVISLVYTRQDVKNLLELDEYISLIIPRGSNKLVKYIKENTKIPVLGHSSGICHIYVDYDCDINETAKIITDSKTQYPSACNAVETLLVHKDYKYLTELKKLLEDNEIKIIENPKDFSVEYGDKILSLKTVNNVDCAIEHINRFSSGHTDSILSNDKYNIEKFMNLVDSSSVFSNCSTRFSDGYRYGFGAEVGISTNKTHARGPVGLEGLMIYKYKLYGTNNTVDDYVRGIKTFTHKML